MASSRGRGRPVNRSCFAFGLQARPPRCACCMPPVILLNRSWCVPRSPKNNSCARLNRTSPSHSASPGFCAVFCWAQPISFRPPRLFSSLFPFPALAGPGLWLGVLRSSVVSCPGFRRLLWVLALPGSPDFASSPAADAENKRHKNL